MHSSPWCLQPIFQLLCCWTLSQQHDLWSLAYSMPWLLSSRKVRMQAVSHVLGTSSVSAHAYQASPTFHRYLVLWFLANAKVLLSSNEPCKRLEPMLLCQWYWHPTYVDLSDYHCVTLPHCGCPWHSASARSPTHLVLFFTSSAVTLFSILWARSIALVRFILWINSQGSLRNVSSVSKNSIKSRPYY
jgi:hypothetical protein